MGTYNLYAVKEMCKKSIHTFNEIKISSWLGLAFVGVISASVAAISWICVKIFKKYNYVATNTPESEKKIDVLVKENDSLQAQVCQKGMELNELNDQYKTKISILQSTLDSERKNSELLKKENDGLQRLNEDQLALTNEVAGTCEDLRESIHPLQTELAPEEKGTELLKKENDDPQEYISEHVTFSELNPQGVNGEDREEYLLNQVVQLMNSPRLLTKEDFAGDLELCALVVDAKDAKIGTLRKEMQEKVDVKIAQMLVDSTKLHQEDLESLKEACEANPKFALLLQRMAKDDTEDIEKKAFKTLSRHVGKSPDAWDSFFQSHQIAVMVYDKLRTLSGNTPYPKEEVKGVLRKYFDYPSATKFTFLKK